MSAQTDSMDSLACVIHTCICMTLNKVAACKMSQYAGVYCFYTQAAIGNKLCVTSVLTYKHCNVEDTDMVSQVCVC